MKKNFIKSPRFFSNLQKLTVKKCALKFFKSTLRLFFISNSNDFSPNNKLLLASLLASKNRLAKKQPYLHRYCVITGRSKSIMRRFGLSRLVVRRSIADGLLLGYRKSSW